MTGTLPNTDQPRIPHSEYRDIWRRRQDLNYLRGTYIQLFRSLYKYENL